ncbi:alpha-1-antitrypsin-like isoform X1 [Trachemys scripta elegans]|uniref:alpha-1-antitrypsin-like isoform X1 n=2 Tax=Trachemys scripta elegans TaxID=31138 RepID=UPI0015528C3D|nr:alpha-1-antitrypsin-like isoform X1 [Trachemys scripta elegans]XP_034625509.1 alpha-1-antitrypsin-like isoform X1 [Trachemys scripta elegans]XP_034625510.1 alpha-1-antitrypsin-like isoform X1 [Trachemys scripta elegans]
MIPLHDRLWGPLQGHTLPLKEHGLYTFVTNGDNFTQRETKNLRKMKSIFYLCFLIAGIHADIPCQQNSSNNSPENYHGGNRNQVGPANENMLGHKVGRSICQFAFYFYKEASSQRNNRNVIFSPISISTAFAMLTLGAKSETLQQILRVFHFKPNEIQQREIHEGFCQLMQSLNRQNANFQLDMGNVLFVKDQLKLQQQFLNDLKNFYSGEAFPENFKNVRPTQQKINNYIEKKTHGKIINLLNNLDPVTEILLVSYIYLKATWNKTFNPKYTKDDDFFVDRNTVVKVPMMFRMGMCKHAYDDQLSSTVVQMDYKEESIKAYFILPDEGQMRKLENGLSCESLPKWRKLLSESSTNLYLPRFSIHGKFDLKQILYRMGIRNVFTNEADLSGITGRPRHRISEAIHQAMVNVDENGTEASAASTVEIVPMSTPTNIKFNRPFMMMIFSNDTILFMGKIMNPVEQ